MHLLCESDFRQRSAHTRKFVVKADFQLRLMKETFPCERGLTLTDSDTANSMVKKTRNAWQSLAYSPLGVVVSSLANIYEAHPQLLITAVPNSPPQANVADLSVVK